MYRTTEEIFADIKEIRLARHGLGKNGPADKFQSEDDFKGLTERGREYREKELALSAELTEAALRAGLHAQREDEKTKRDLAHYHRATITLSRTLRKVLKNEGVLEQGELEVAAALATMSYISDTDDAPAYTMRDLHDYRKASGFVAQFEELHKDQKLLNNELAAPTNEI